MSSLNVKVIQKVLEVLSKNISVNVRPIARLNLTANVSFAQKGEEYFYAGTTDPGSSVWGLTFLENERWSNNSILFSSSYELFNDVFISLDYQYQKVEGVDAIIYTSPFYQGSTNTFSAKINIGF